jgi:hypothetical protein
VVIYIENLTKSVAHDMSPLTPIAFASVFDTEIGIDGKVYIAQYVEDNLCWVCMSDDSPTETTKSRQLSKSKSTTPNKYPSIPLDCVCVNDVFTGEDGNSYIARKVKGQMSWSLLTKTHEWNSTKITYLTINHEDLSTCTETVDKASKQRSRKRSSKKN